MTFTENLGLFKKGPELRSHDKDTKTGGSHRGQGRGSEDLSNHLHRLI